MENYGPAFAICTSFQREGMVLIDMAARLGQQFLVITLDTGRLPDETLQMIDKVRRRYGIEVEVISPDPGEVESMVAQHGRDLFFDDPALRKLCCHVRKTRPLERRLGTLAAWAVGLRREQSTTRAAVPRVDRSRKPVKLSPLAAWTGVQVEEYIRRNGVPQHPLYALGYTSIGCEPCTRAVEAGEDERAGRWWWEQDGTKECGIHFSGGKAQRRLDVLIEQVLEAGNA
jgi:phosphoadenylyl-sulfate reductase (thioredoxin)